MEKYIVIYAYFFLCGCTNTTPLEGKTYYYEINYQEFLTDIRSDKMHNIYVYYFDKYINGKNCNGGPPRLANNMLYISSCISNAKLINKDIVKIYKGDVFSARPIAKEKFDFEQAKRPKNMLEN